MKYHPDAEEKTVAQSMVDAFAELAKVENATAESIANTLATNETLAFIETEPEEPET